MNQSAENLVTYYDLKPQPMDQIRPNAFAQIDFILCTQLLLTKIHDIYTTRQLPLSSHHFLMQCHMHLPMQIEKKKKSEMQIQKYDYGIKTDETIQRKFLHTFTNEMQNKLQKGEINYQLLQMNDAIRQSMRLHLPEQTPTKRRPWISSTTLNLIEKRCQYRQQNNAEKEKEITKAIKKQIKLDKEMWLNECLENGNWQAIKKYQRKKKIQIR